MSTQTFQVRADTCVPVDRSIFNLSAFGSETMVDSDQGLLPAKFLTTQHRLKCHRGLHADIEWIERLDLSAYDLNRYPDLKPVVIPAGYFGTGLPRRDTLLSPGQKLWAKRPGGTQSHSARRECWHPTLCSFAIRTSRSATSLSLAPALQCSMQKGCGCHAEVPCNQQSRRHPGSTVTQE